MIKPQYIPPESSRFFQKSRSVVLLESIVLGSFDAIVLCNLRFDVREFLVQLSNYLKLSMIILCSEFNFRYQISSSVGVGVGRKLRSLWRGEEAGFAVAISYRILVAASSTLIARVHRALV